MDDSISTAIPLTTSQFTVESAQGFLDFESTWFIDKESGINHAQLISNPEVKHVHNYSPSITNPTCTEKGYTTHTCECGKSYITDYTEPKGHSFDTWGVKVQPTCQNEGVLIRYCSKCTAYEEMSISKVHSFFYIVSKINDAASLKPNLNASTSAVECISLIMSSYFSRHSFCSGVKSAESF